MYDEIIEAINNSDWKSATYYLSQIDESEYNDTVAVLSVAIAFGECRIEDAFEEIRRGLEYNGRNYELYLYLGQYYENFNMHQAVICYEQALFYCDDERDSKVIRGFLEKINLIIPKTAIIILSYNALSDTKRCIESIRATTQSNQTEIIVVDNASGDGSVQWLQNQRGIKLIFNEENKGFPYACNQGIGIADPKADIFLLNADTVMTDNALFWLKMGLYSGGNVGATGSLTNRAVNDQQINLGTDLSGCIDYARKCNLPMRYAYEEKIFLVGFAMLIRREAMKEIGELDIRFSPGTYEDNDYGIRLHKAGWHVYLCHNSFIYHTSMLDRTENQEKWIGILPTNQRKFQQKWHFDLEEYIYPKEEIMDFIKPQKRESISVLEIGCGFGANLNRIKYLLPYVEVYGIEDNKEVADIASQYENIIYGELENTVLPFESKKFDYIIFDTVIEGFQYPEITLKGFQRYLTKNGKYICVMKNELYHSLTLPMLKSGEVEARLSMMMDKVCDGALYVKKIYELFSRTGMEIQNMSGIVSLEPEVERLIGIIANRTKVANSQHFKCHQYIFEAKKI